MVRTKLTIMVKITIMVIFKNALNYNKNTGPPKPEYIRQGHYHNYYK